MAANELEETREQLAAIEHERWADWQKYMLECTHEDHLGQVVFNSYEQVKHWERQIATPYSELSELEQKSDLEQVDRYWPIILSLIESEKVKARIDECEKIIELLSPGYDYEFWFKIIPDRIKELESKEEAK